jgi:kumamolisin
MSLRSLHQGLRTALFACSLAFPISAFAAQTVTLQGNLPAALASAKRLNRVAGGEKISLALVLPLRNQGQLDDLLQRLYTPGDLMYGQYLTSSQFAEQFSPTQADYDAVIAFAKSQGLTVVSTHPNRTIVDVVGNAQTVERAFGVQLNQYQLENGRIFRAPSSEPQIPAQLSGRLVGVLGLDNSAVWHAHHARRSSAPASAGAPGTAPVPAPNAPGSGPGGGLAPNDIKAAYNLNGIGTSGVGQSLALFELDGYLASDIAKYEGQFGLPNVLLQNILVDGFDGSAGGDAIEVVLDIDMQIALAPNINKILVYEAPNSFAGVVDTYNRIATDNLAKSVSTSWGLAEQYNSTSGRKTENQTFQQMAVQGQSIFAASGDSGAYADGSTISVQDPASQPFMTVVGGTTLTTKSTGGAWKSETNWNNNSGSGGGGISTLWAKPAYQSFFGISSTFRNEPDVSLNADPYTGYAIYLGGWTTVGGTSAAAPLWSAYVACVNQGRIATGKTTLGFANPLIYKIGAGSRFAPDFHDIKDNSTNRFYHAMPGYDNSTGWGTINAGLYADLVNGTFGPPPPPPPFQLLGNPGFEKGASGAPWVGTSGLFDNSADEAAHSGTWKAWLGGYGTVHTDTLTQKVAIPYNSVNVMLSYWLHVDTQETTTSTANDTLNVQIRSESGALLETLGSYSNLDAATGFTQMTFDLNAYKGQTIQLYIVSVENGSRTTSFIMDDFAMTTK